MKEVTSDNEKVSTLDRIVDEQRPAMERYREITLGEGGLLFLLRYELAMILCNGLSGAVGLWLRKKLYPGLFGKVGNGVVFGKNISLRHPGRIQIGDGTIVDDCCVLDARAEADISISIGSNTFVARDTIIACKGGNIQIGDRVGIGARTTIHSYVGNEVEIGNKVLIGPYCYIVGAGLYNTEETDVPIADQGILLKGGVKIGDNAWLGARATIIDGVTVGNDSIVAAGAVVTRDVPPFSVVAGVPARVIKDRKESA